MNQSYYLPFSALVASMLLFKRQVTDLEIVDLSNKLENENIFFKDEDDSGMDKLFLCVDCFDYAYFKIKDDLELDSILDGGISVEEYLKEIGTEYIIEYIKNNKILCAEDIVKNEKRRIKSRGNIKFNLLTSIFRLGRWFKLNLMY